VQTVLPTTDLELRERLTWDHHRLEQLFVELQASFDEDDDLRARRRLWSELDRGLTVHMDAEEKYVLSAFARTDPVEAAALLAEHSDIRRRLTELGIGVDLHTVSAQRCAEFLDTLRRHAAREDALLYRWAQANLPAGEQERMIEHVPPPER